MLTNLLTVHLEGGEGVSHGDDKDTVTPTAWPLDDGGDSSKSVHEYPSADKTGGFYDPQKTEEEGFICD